MPRLRLVPTETRLDFLRLRRVAAALSVILVVGSLALVGLRGLNFGIDFQGGTIIEARTAQPADLAAMRDDLAELNLGEISLQTFGSPRDILIRVQAQETREQDAEVLPAVEEALSQPIDIRRTEFVGPVVGEEMIQAGAMAVGIALLAILGYIWLRFEWQFGLGAVVALTHDIATTIGLFALLQLDFNLATVAAILTIAGYSINDTVVIYDRVRENMRRYKRKPLVELLNRSLNEVLARTVMTSVTTLLALIALFLFGGEIIRGFSIALIWGVVIGTYSSMFVAVPVLLRFNLERSRQKQQEQEEQEKHAERTSPEPGPAQ